MTQPRTIEGRQFSSYIESATRPNSSASEVFVGNTQENPIPVNPSKLGDPQIVFNEVNSVGIETLTLLNITVQAGKVLCLTKLKCSGENIACFNLLINDSLKLKQRTFYTNFNLDLEFNELPLNEGDNIKVTVDNNTNSSASFNATLEYNDVTL